MLSKECTDEQNQGCCSVSVQVCAHRRQKVPILRQQQSRRGVDCLSLVCFHRFEPSLLLDSACVTICIIPDNLPCDHVECYCTQGMTALVRGMVWYGMVRHGSVRYEGNGAQQGLRFIAEPV